MRVGSFLELATTMIGWHIAGAIANLLVTSGMILLPFAIALIKNWSEPVRSQESKAAAPVSLRRMEQDVSLFALVLILFFLPAIPIVPEDIEFRNSELDRTVLASDPDAAYVENLDDLGEFEVPVAWWLVSEVASFITESITAAIDRLGNPAILRAELLRASRMRITDELLVGEIRDFRKDCYEPALAKYQRSGNLHPSSSYTELHLSVDWIGSRIFVETPGYYKQCTDVNQCGTGYRASSRRQDWFSGTSGSGLPYCDKWWTDSRIGLRIKIIDALKDQVPSLDSAIETTRKMQASKRKDGVHLNVEDYEDRYLRRAINLSPWVFVDRADRAPQHHRTTLDFFTSFDGWQQIIASIGSLSVSAVLHIIMELVVIGLPMLQALLLMLVYISIPIIVPYATLNPSVLVRVALLLFSLRFLTALWAIAAFLDDKLLAQMYPDANLFEFGGSGSTADIVLNLITLTAYLTLPVAWFYIIASIGPRMGTQIAAGIGQLGDNLHRSSAKSTSTITETIGKRIQ